MGRGPWDALSGAIIGQAGMSMKPLRSFLFVPGNRERFLEKLETLRPDAVILDLEDSVPPAEKEAARQMVRAVLLSNRFAEHQLFVRVNGFGTGLTAADLAAVACSRLQGVFLPKVDSVEALRQANRLLALAESRAGLEIGTTRVIPIVETVRGIAQVTDLASCGPRISGLNFGYDDFALDLGVVRSPDGIETFYPRARVALAARAADLLAIDGSRADFGDLDALVEECRVSRQLGFTGKQCIHPSQIEPVNRAFSPAPEEVARAREVVAAYEAAERQGQGSGRLGDLMVDRPVVERARRLIALDQQIRSGDLRAGDQPG
jgi:citrate lyase subunit beta/citryl-CoA lyase